MSPGGGHRWTLQELEARWLKTKGRRYNIGISFDCPAHGSHRLIVRFTNPYDGDGPVLGEGLMAYVEANGTLDKLTLTSPHGLDELNFNHMGHGECGRYRIVEGKVERVRF